MFRAAPALAVLLAISVQRPARFESFPVDLRATPTVSGARLRLAVKAPSSGATVRKFVIVHERPMHLFVVGSGLEFFAHEFPVQQPDGVFMVDLVLPKPGPYLAVAEFHPEGATPQMFQQVFTTGGALDATKPSVVETSAKSVDSVSVALDSSRLKVGAPSALVARVTDVASGAEVTDLEPYLGSRAHVLIVSSDLTEAVHAHSEDEIGSVLTFTPLLPRAGDYRVWVLLQRRGTVLTVPFWIRVKP